MSTKEKYDNESVIRWSQPSYTVLETKELSKLPKSIQKMIVNHLLIELNIPMRVE